MSLLEKPAKLSQTARILKVLKEHGSVTNAYLNDHMHIYRYSARIAELRREDHIIVTNRIKGGLYEFVYRGERQ